MTTQQKVKAADQIDAEFAVQAKKLKVLPAQRQQVDAEAAFQKATVELRAACANTGAELPAAARPAKVAPSEAPKSAAPIRGGRVPAAPAARVPKAKGLPSPKNLAKALASAPKTPIVKAPLNKFGKNPVPPKAAPPEHLVTGTPAWKRRAMKAQAEARAAHVIYQLWKHTNRMIDK